MISKVIVVKLLAFVDWRIHWPHSLHDPYFFSSLIIHRILSLSYPQSNKVYLPPLFPFSGNRQGQSSHSHNINRLEASAARNVCTHTCTSSKSIVGESSICSSTLGRGVLYRRTVYFCVSELQSLAMQESVWRINSSSMPSAVPCTG